MTSLHEVALLRLAAQRIAGPSLPTAAEAVRWMTALQAQDYNGALTSVALRTSPRSRRDVEAALDVGEVRSWSMRATLHLVAAEDLPWMLQLLTPRVVAGAAGRRARLGLDERTLERARELAVEALAGGRRLSRDDLLAVWDGAGLATTAQRGYHLLWHLAQTGTLCFGPVRDGQQLIVLIEVWIPRPRRLERDEALAELAWRYFRSHGPATVKDLMRWAHLVAADAPGRPGPGPAPPGDPRRRRGRAPHGPTHARAARLVPPGGAGRVPAAGVRRAHPRLPDRSCMVASEHADRIVPGVNGMFRATVVSDGQVLGTWKHAGRGSKRRAEATPFKSFPT